MTEVTHRDDPGRRGILTGRKRERSDGAVLQVRWQDNTLSWVPEYQLIVAEAGGEDVFTLLERQRFGRVNDLRRNLTHIHLSGRLANVVYSMDTTNTDFYAYQYKPVLTFLESPSKGVLIADEVGLGKTIEAGLIWTELRARYDARRLVVVCPAMLREKWCDELRARFGVEAAQLSAADLLRELKQPKANTREGKGFVCSLQGLRPPSGWNSPERRSADAELARVLDELAEIEPSIDLLIIDEAHYLRNPETRSAELGRLLRDVSEHVVLLSATPVNNKEQDLFELLRLVDPDTFAVAAMFPQVLEANEPLIKARRLALDPIASEDSIKAELRTAAAHSLFAGNRQLAGLLERPLEAEYLAERSNRVDLADRIERINLLRHTVNRTRKVEVTELHVVRDPHSQFVPLPLEGVEWQFYRSVTEAVRSYAYERDINDGFLLAPPQRQVSSCMYAAARSWLDKTGYKDLESMLYEDQGADDVVTVGVGPLIEHIVQRVLGDVDIEELRRIDSKYAAFHRVLTEHFASHPQEKVIVFSYFRRTLEYLAERLREDGIPNVLLYGGMNVPKQDVINGFRDDTVSRVLLTSEVASEGVDLQFSRVLVNYDLPWNPMKIEQRIGRIDRIGQQADMITIWNLGYAKTIDERIFERLLNKLHIFERSLGGMEAILGDIVNDLTSDLLSRPLTEEEEVRRIDQAFTAAENNRLQQEQLEANAGHLIAHAGYILERVKAAHEFKRRITDDDLKVYVKDYLDRHARGSEFRQSDRDPYFVHVRLPPETAAALAEYVRKNRLHGQTRLGTGERIPCRFQNSIRGLNRRDEVVSQFHPLTRFISAELDQRNEAFHPLVALQVVRSAGKDLQPGTYACSVKRWTFNGLQTHEELHARALRLDGGGGLLERDQAWELVNAARVHGSDWLSAPNEISTKDTRDAFDRCDMQLEEDYARVRADRINENEDRVSFQVESTEKHMRRLLSRQQDLLEKYRARGQKNVIPMTQGRIRAIETKFAVQIEGLKKKGELTSFSSDVAYGVIRVN